MEANIKQKQLLLTSLPIKKFQIILIVVAFIMSRKKTKRRIKLTQIDRREINERGKNLSKFCVIFLILIVGVESNLVHSGRRPLIGLLYLLRVSMRMENLVEW
jgi:uncharacterized membrane protein YfcA